MLLATTRYWRVLQLAPMSLSIASLQRLRTTRVVRRLAAETTLRNLSGSMRRREERDSSRCSSDAPFFLMH